MYFVTYCVQAINFFQFFIVDLKSTFPHFERNSSKRRVEPNCINDFFPMETRFERFYEYFLIHKILYTNPFDILLLNSESLVFVWKAIKNI